MTWRSVLAVALLINLLGTVFGYYYYQNLLASSPAWKWIFIPDSPNSTLIFSAAIVLILLGRPSSTLGALGCVYIMKYGLWTMFVILYFPEFFLAPRWADYYWLMFWLHLGMVLEPLLILHTLRKNLRTLLVPLVLLLINDYADYAAGTSPLYSFPLDGLGVTPVFSVFETLVLSIVVYRLAENKTLARIWEGKAL